MKKLFLAVLLCSFAVMCNQNAEAVIKKVSESIVGSTTSEGSINNLLSPFAEINTMTVDNIDVTRWAYVEYTENLMQIILYDYNLVFVEPGARVSIEISFKNVADERFYSNDVSFYASANMGGAAPGILYSDYSSTETAVHYSVDRIWGGENYTLSSGFYLNRNSKPLKVEVLLPIHMK